MNKAIKTYDDLLRYELDLKETMGAHKRFIQHDIHEIMEDFAPLKSLVRLGARFLIPNEDNSLLTNGVISLINLAFKKIILSKSGWMSRLILPFVARNITSHLVASNKNKILDKLASWIAK